MALNCEDQEVLAAVAPDYGRITYSIEDDRSFYFNLNLFPCSVLALKANIRLQRKAFGNDLVIKDALEFALGILRS